MLPGLIPRRDRNREPGDADVVVHVTNIGRSDPEQDLELIAVGTVADLEQTLHGNRIDPVSVVGEVELRVPDGAGKFDAAMLRHHEPDRGLQDHGSRLGATEETDVGRSHGDLEPNRVQLRIVRDSFDRRLHERIGGQDHDLSRDLSRVESDDADGRDGHEQRQTDRTGERFARHDRTS